MKTGYTPAAREAATESVETGPRGLGSNPYNAGVTTVKPTDPHNDPVVKSLAETVTDLDQVIEAEKVKRHRLQAELESSLTEIDGAARNCDQWAAVLEKLLAAVSSRRDTLDARQDAARDALTATIAGEMGGTP